MTYSQFYAYLCNENFYKKASQYFSNFWKLNQDPKTKNEKYQSNFPKWPSKMFWASPDQNTVSVFLVGVFIQHNPNQIWFYVYSECSEFLKSILHKLKGYENLTRYL